MSNAGKTSPNTSQINDFNQPIKYYHNLVFYCFNIIVDKTEHIHLKSKFRTTSEPSLMMTRGVAWVVMMSWFVCVSMDVLFVLMSYRVAEHVKLVKLFCLGYGYDTD